MRNYQSLMALLGERDEKGLPCLLHMLWGPQDVSARDTWSEMVESLGQAMLVHNHRTARQYLEVFMGEVVVFELMEASKATGASMVNSIRLHA